jgi:hypothetical protein
MRELGSAFKMTLARVRRDASQGSHAEHFLVDTLFSNIATRTTRAPRDRKCATVTRFVSATMGRINAVNSVLRDEYQTAAAYIARRGQCACSDTGSQRGCLSGLVSHLLRQDTCDLCKPGEFA